MLELLPEQSQLLLGPEHRIFPWVQVEKQFSIYTKKKRKNKTLRERGKTWRMGRVEGRGEEENRKRIR